MDARLVFSEGNWGRFCDFRLTKQEATLEHGRVASTNEHNMIRYAITLLFFVLLAVPCAAPAGEADDLHQQIDQFKQSTSALERQDEQKAVAAEIATMRAWLDSAWTLRSQEKFDEVRIVLDRCNLQADLIRQRLALAKLLALAATKEDEVKRARNQLARTHKAIENAKIQRARLEGQP
jgi:hypothetical protein